MPDRRLRIVGDHAAPPRCRTTGCDFRADDGELGYCPPCQAVYDAARELRERLLERRGARLRAQHRIMLDQLSPAVCERLVAHMAANSADRGRPAGLLDLAGLEDFFAELRELGLSA